MTVVKLEFGQERPKSQGKFFRVKEKGDTITFRIGQAPVYTGKHFIQKEDGWDVTECERITGGGECELCEKFFKAKAEEKKAHEAGDSETEKKAKGEARKYGASVIYYYSVLNRLTEEATFLQTTEGVHKQINNQFLAGVKILERDLILTNTGSDSPKDRYVIAVVDSADSKELTDKEKEELKKAQEVDLSAINEGKNVKDETEAFDVPEQDPADIF